MAEENLDGWVVPSEDAHLSEYVADCDRRRSFLTGFTGSAGLALVTKHRALCWTDGRYFLQAEIQLDLQHWTLMKSLEDVSLEKWIVANLGPRATVGIFDQTVSTAMYDRLQKELGGEAPKCAAVESHTGAAQIRLNALPISLVDELWGPERPPLPSSKIFRQDEAFAGQSTTDKIRVVRGLLEGKVQSDSLGVPIEIPSPPGDVIVVSALDEIAWLLNLRGSDIEFNPVFWAYVVISQTSVCLYVNSSRLEDSLGFYLESNGVVLRPYESILEDLTSSLVRDKITWVAPASCNMAILQAVERAPAKQIVKTDVSPVAILKALKNPAELEGMRQCHIRDGSAVVRFLAWLENEITQKNRQPTECEAADVLEQFRRGLEHYVSLAFDTISASGSNGAIIHYKPERTSCAEISDSEMYLCDSGGQYKDGTTDVTRTVHHGQPGSKEKEHYTRVLKGHISLGSCKFPEGTTGHVLDILARKSLWDVGLDYKHGTGHGVGAFLNVHEGPQLISFRSTSAETPMRAGMTITNEPGFYLDGKYGIRIENVLIVKQTNLGDSKRKYLGFENITWVPLEPKLIDSDLLSTNEIDWVNTYHMKCRTVLEGHLRQDPSALSWLHRKTGALGR